ncbi:uncharacterized protein LOC111412718 [Olea europaea var. sylvestris]|uniref:uncharacterized protein LOC111412718 n=1 Tax=Olea europaea var. sylvestris TaxID=158386 RepID=UPI000C1D3718|nr:uncharacterized protein LOC111412718 [Olea europaea var. sylvestris]
MRGNPPVIRQQQDKRQSLEDLLAKYITMTEMVMQNQQASIHNLENHMGQIAAALANKPQGALSNDTEKNPREQVLAVEVVNYATIELPSLTSTIPVKAYAPPFPFPQRLQRQPTVEPVQAITTKSGVQLPEITTKRKEIERTQTPGKGKEPMEQSEEAIEKGQLIVSDSQQLKTKVPSTSPIHPVPFSQRLQKTKLEKQAMKFLKVLKKLHVNILFIDPIIQIPNYSNFLKEMLTKEMKMPEHETIILSKECSMIIQHRIHPKLKDPESFTLPCSIGNLQVINCLIDSGASINLIHLSLYGNLGLGDPKEASIILQLADSSLKHSYGIVEDMLIKM